jgi:hypothetical protein
MLRNSKGYQTHGLLFTRTTSTLSEKRMTPYRPLNAQPIPEERETISSIGDVLKFKMLKRKNTPKSRMHVKAAQIVAVTKVGE